MTAERSLEIIRKTIEQNRRSVSENAGNSFLLWGVLVVVFSLVVGHLWKHNGGPVWNFLWFFIWIPGLLGERYLKKKRKHVPDNYVGRVIGNVWLTFGLFCCTLALTPLVMTVFGVAVPVPEPGVRLFMPMTSIYILCLGMATTISGFILKNTVIIVCGFVAAFGGFVAGIFFSGANSMLVMAGVSLIGLVLPGVLTNLQTKRHV